MKYLLVIGDGMADNPIDALGNKTPLQAANKPTIDALARKGRVGTVRTIPEGLAAGSDVATLSIFGCDPHTAFSGRAPLEAAANDIEMNPGDVAFRCNIVSLEDTFFWYGHRMLLSHNADSISPEESDALIEWLFYDTDFGGLAYRDKMTVYPGHSFRHIVVMEDGADKVKGLVLTPPHDHIGDRIDNLLPSGCAHAEHLKYMMSCATELLEEHPINEKRRAEGRPLANGIWFWAAGTAMELPKFKDKYGCDGAMIAAVPICRGLGKLLGLERIDVEGANGELDTNYEGKADAALEQLKKYDFVTVHVEAPDECAHNGDLDGKVKSIEYIDSRVVKRIVDGLDASGEDYRILFLSDHKTLMSNRAHDGDPVPYMIYDSRTDTKADLPSDEKSGEQGEFLEDGMKLLDILFEK